MKLRKLVPCVLIVLCFLPGAQGIHGEQRELACDTMSLGNSECFLDVFFLNNKLGWLTSWGGGIFHTADGGNSWEKQESGLPYEWLKGIWFTDKHTGWICGSDGSVLTTDDGGSTWVNTPVPDANLLDIQFVTKQNGWVCGSQGRIYHSRDGGKNWEIQPTGVKSLLTNLYFVSEKTTSS